MSRCRSCGAAVIFCQNAEGNREILDASPTNAGNRVIVDGLVRARQEVDIQLGRAAYTSHYATCPQAAAWRKGGK